MEVHTVLGMNKLPLAKRVQALSMLCEGSSMRSISRVVDVSINTVTKLLEDAGRACAAHHDATVRGVKAKRVQCDEIWSFCYAKEKNVETAKKAPEEAGDVWTWTALDDVEDLVVPPDLAEAFAARPGAREHWEGFPRSVRRGVLEWLLGAKRPATRAARITEIADDAERGERAHQWKQAR